MQQYITKKAWTSHAKYGAEILNHKFYRVQTSNSTQILQNQINISKKTKKQKGIVWKVLQYSKKVKK